MQLNQPSDPRYNAKLYIPKLTEEERRARATPLENLRSLRFRSAPAEIQTLASAIPDPAPASLESINPPSTVPTPTTVDAAPQNGPVQPCVPTAQDVVRAAFPEIYGPAESLDSRLPWRMRNRTACERFQLDKPLQHPGIKPPAPKVTIQRAEEINVPKSRAPSAEADGGDAIGLTFKKGSWEAALLPGR